MRAENSKESTMTQEQKVIRAKVDILELAEPVRIFVGEAVEQRVIHAPA